jgi:hypothetical protein
MALTTPLPSPKAHHPSLLYEHHPQLGDYIYEPSINAWTHRRAMMDGQLLLVRGRGRSPSDEQINLWEEIEARLPELTGAAVAVIGEPPVKPRRATFSRAALVLVEVRMELHGSIEFYFSSPIEDEIDMGPMVAFSGWTATRAAWVC